MNINKKMQDAINEQINAEFYSAFLYLSMSAYFQTINLPGFAHWMEIQYKEESMHAMKFYNYVIERGGEVELKNIEAPKIKWNSPVEAFEDTLAHEQKVTGLINNLMDLAIDERDHASRIELQWFITEQVEEEANATELLEKLKMIADDPKGLLMMDQDLASRPEPSPING